MEMFEVLGQAVNWNYPRGEVEGQGLRFVIPCWLSRCLRQVGLLVAASERAAE